MISAFLERGGRKQSAVLRQCSSFGRVIKCFTRRALQVARCASISPIIFKASIFSLRVVEMAEMPPMGEPNSVASLVSTTNAPDRDNNKDTLASWLQQMTTAVSSSFSCNPISSPTFSTTCRPCLMSSILHRRHPGKTRSQLGFQLLKGEATAKGPKGSPCCTPSADWMVLSFKNNVRRWGGIGWVDKTEQSRDYSSRTFINIQSLWMELKVFLKSNLKRALEVSRLCR